MSDFGFAPASEGEQIVFGAQRPGYPSKSVNQGDIQKWMAFMKKQSVSRICCLLPRNQLDYYKPADILNIYSKEFGEENVLWIPIEDFHLCDIDTLKKKILPFIKKSEETGKRIVVHCSGGSGRTGHVLAAWLVFGRGFSIEEALKAGHNKGRNPYEAVDCGNATKEELHALLLQCKRGNIA